MESTENIAKSIMRMPINSGNAGHGVIEVNQCCNIKCKACYKNKSSYQKPLKQIKDEIDHLLKVRNVKVISLAGGEPTMHPEICEVIEYIKSKKIKSAIISNGFKLSEKGFLEDIKTAGIDFIVLHIDPYQKRQDLPMKATTEDVIILVKKLSKNIQKKDIGVQMAYTVYKSDLKNLEKIIKFYLEDPNLELFTAFDYSSNFNWKGIKDLLSRFPLFNKGDLKKVPFTLRLKKEGLSKKKAMELISDTKSDYEVVWNKEIYKKMLSFGFHPHWYLPSNINKNDLKWLYYSIFVLFDKKGKCEMISFKNNFLSTKLIPLIYKTYLYVKGAFPVMFNFRDKKNSYKFMIYHVILSFICLNFHEAHNKIRFLVKGLDSSNKLFVKPIIFQEPLRINKRGEFVYCYSCPDATIRNGKLVQLCLADFIEPTKTKQKEIKYSVKKGKLYDLLSKKYVD